MSLMQSIMYCGERYACAYLLDHKREFKETDTEAKGAAGLMHLRVISSVEYLVVLSTKSRAVR
jgi:hypothetical protein